MLRGLVLRVILVTIEDQSYSDEIMVVSYTSKEHGFGISLMLLPFSITKYVSKALSL